MRRDHSPRGAVRCGLALLIACLIQWGAAKHAEAAVRTCIRVTVPENENQTAFRQLVATELSRHPSHVVVDSDCRSFLLVEWFEVGDTGYVTARANTQVPVRVTVGKRELADAITELLTIALHNDPVLLRGPRQRSWMGTRLRALKAGNTLYRLELAQVGAWVDGGVQTLPGVALGMSREILQWEVLFRAQGSMGPSSQRPELHLTHWLSADVGARYFFSPTAATSFFYGAGLGLSHQRYRGPSLLGGDNALDTGFGTVPIVVTEVGVELFRTTQSRVNLGWSLQVPLLKTHDIDTGVVDAWVPSATFRAGMAL